jgi:3-phenylpropionate/trans-cinnamate dioxygenase ferredoxin component
MSEYQKVATIDELSPGGRLSLVFDDRSVILFQIGADFYAVEDVCSHDGQPLTDGRLEGTSIECPRHGARFDVRTGRPLCMPAVEPIEVFNVKLDGRDILIRSRS